VLEYFTAHAYNWIAKPLTPNGSTQFDPADSFEIVGELLYSLQGHLVHKVGIRTGWTYGSVTRTCTDYFTGGDERLLCQDEANLNSDRGDSGSPVFMVPGYAHDSTTPYR
jgi:hypothetical protein